MKIFLDLVKKTNRSCLNDYKISLKFYSGKIITSSISGVFFIGGYNWKKFNVIMNQLKWTKDNSSYFTDEINRNFKKLEFSDEINRRLIICTVTTFHVILRVYHQNCLLIVYNLRHVHDSQTTCKHTKAWRLWLLLMIFFIQTNTSLLQKRS